MPTGQEVCKTIARAIKLETGETVSPKDIWEQSLTGELINVYAQYESAREVLKSRGAKNIPPSLMDARTRRLMEVFQRNEDRARIRKSYKRSKGVKW